MTTKSISRWDARRLGRRELRPERGSTKIRGHVVPDGSESSWCGRRAGGNSTISNCKQNAAMVFPNFKVLGQAGWAAKWLGIRFFLLVVGRGVLERGAGG